MQTAEALSSLGTLCAALGNVSGARAHSHGRSFLHLYANFFQHENTDMDCAPHTACNFFQFRLQSGMRMHYSACLEMLHRLQDVDRFAAVLLDFVTLCVQAGVDQQQVWL